jgi:hypothetical protein
VVAVNGPASDALVKAHAKLAVDVLSQFVKLIDTRVQREVQIPPPDLKRPLLGHLARASRVRVRCA